MALIKNILRPLEWDSDNETMLPSEYLRIELDVYEDGSFIDTVMLAFSDFAGLEAEWDAGLATTVMEDAIADVLADNTETDPLPVSYRGSVGGQILPSEE